MSNETFQKYKPWVIGGSVAAVVLVIILAFVFAHNSVINKGNKKQQDLIYYYNQTTNVLSDCLVKTKQSVGATQAQTAALDKVITDAVKGRYTLGSTAQPGSGQLFSAIQEAYPDLSGLSQTYNKVLTIINGCRTDFRNAQSELQINVTRFNSWRTGSWTVRHLGGGNFPNDDLEITVAGKPVTGEAALRQMRTLVVVTDAQTGRDTGHIDNNDPFAGS